MTFAYGLSKGALMLHTAILAKAGRGLVNAYSCTPGLTATDMLADYKGPRTPNKPEDAAKIIELCCFDVPGEHSGEFLRLRKGEVSSEPMILRPHSPSEPR